MAIYYANKEKVYGTVRERMKKLRGKKTQGYIADQLNVSRSLYCRIENGKQDPSLNFLIDLANYYHTTISYFVGDCIGR